MCWFRRQPCPPLINLNRRWYRHNVPRQQLKATACAILISFVCYIATLVGTLWNPIWGSLMLPKTIAYVITIYKFYQVEFQR